MDMFDRFAYFAGFRRILQHFAQDSILKTSKSIFKSFSNLKKLNFQKNASGSMTCLKFLAYIYSINNFLTDFF